MTNVGVLGRQAPDCSKYPDATMALRSMVHGFRVQSNDSTEAITFFTPDFHAQNSLSTFSTKTLVVPIVSAANVPQLAVDILIASLSLSRLGIFDPRYLVPVVGGREGGEDGVTTPMELFGKEGLDFVVIQQRSPVLVSQKDKFITSLLQFAQQSRFNSLLFLSGLDPTNRTDSQMFTPIYQLVPTASPSLVGSRLTSLTSLPRYTSQSSPHLKTPSFSGGGLTRRISTSLPTEWNLPTAFLLIFALEGDNRADAVLFAGTVAKVLAVDGTIGGLDAKSLLSVTNRPNFVSGWKEPESWRQGLFGPAHDQSLFG